MIGHKSLCPTSFGSTNTPGPLLRARRLVSLSPLSLLSIFPASRCRSSLTLPLSGRSISLLFAQRSQTHAGGACVSFRIVHPQASLAGPGAGPFVPLGGGGEPRRGPLGRGPPKTPGALGGGGRRGFGPFRGRGSASGSLECLLLANVMKSTRKMV